MIHPIAGKCKHCKADLSSHHAVRPAAATPLPALRASANAAPTSANGQVHWVGKPAAPAQVPSSDGHAASRAVPVAARRDDSQPVLPPRPTNRGYTIEPDARGWRSWPVIVIALAMVAIVVAVVLMVWPTGRHDTDGKRALAPAPAPERMQTAPDIAPPPAPAPAPRAAAPDKPQRAPDPAQHAPDPDPWADPDAPGQAPDPARKPDPDDEDALQNPMLVDPYAAPHAQVVPRPGRHRLSLNGNGMMMMTMAAHLCRKIVQCGTADPTTRQMCGTLSGQAPPPPGNCPAATRCLAQIDTMSCATQSGDLSQIASLLGQFADCSDATRC